MPTVAQLVAEIQADSKQLVAGLNDANKKLDKFAADAERSLSSGMKKATGGASNVLRSFSQEISGLGTKLSLALTAPLVAAAKSTFDAAVKFDSFERALGTIMGSAEAAKREIELLRQATDLPGVTFENALRASQQFQAVGFSADQARNMIIQLGNEGSKAGIDQSEMQRMIINLRQIAGMSKLTGDELREMSAIIPTVGKHIKAAFGTTETDKISKMGITGRQAVEAIMAGFQSSSRAPVDTLRKDLERVQTSLFILKKEVGLIFAPFARQIMDVAVPAMGKLSQLIRSMSEQDRAKLLKLVASIALIGPALLVISAVASGLVNVGAVIAGIGKGFSLLTASIAGAGGALGVIKAGFAALTGPIGIAVALVAALATAFATNFAGVRDILLPVWDSIKGFFAEISDSIRSFAQENGPLLIKAWGDIKGWIEPFFQQMAHTIAGTWEIIKNVIRIALDLIGRYIKVGAQIITGDWSGAWETVKEGFSKTWDRMKLMALNGALAILNVIKSFGDAIGKAIGINFSVLDNSIKSLKKSISDLEKSSQLDRRIIPPPNLNYSSRVEISRTMRQPRSLLDQFKDAFNGFSNNKPLSEKDLLDKYKSLTDPGAFKVPNISGAIGKSKAKKFVDEWEKMVNEIYKSITPMSPFQNLESFVPRFIEVVQKDIKAAQREFLKFAKSLKIPPSSIPNLIGLTEERLKTVVGDEKFSKNRSNILAAFENSLGKFKGDPSPIQSEAAQNALLKNIEEIAEARQKVLDLAKEEFTSLQQRIFLLGKEGELHRMLWEVQEGRFKSLGTIGKAILLSGAARLQQLTEEFQKRSNLVSSVKGELESMRERIALFGKETELEKLLFQMKEGRFKGLGFYEAIALMTGAKRLDQLAQEVKQTEYLRNLSQRIAQGDIIPEFAGPGPFGSILAVAPMLKKKLKELADDSQKSFRDIVRAIKNEWDSIGLSAGELLRKQMKDQHPLWSLGQIDEVARLREKVDNAKNLIDGLANRTHDVFMRVLDDLFKNGFQNFFTNVIQGFRDMIAQIARDIIASQLRLLINNLLGGLFKGGGGGAASPLMLMPGALSFAADGGRIFSNRPYIVGERGPELFLPNRSGMMVPNHELAAVGSGGPINLTLNISTPDVASFRRNEGQIMADAMASARRAAYRNGGR